MVICSQCQSENRSTARFCRTCGAALPHSESVATLDTDAPLNGTESATMETGEESSQVLSAGEVPSAEISADGNGEADHRTDDGSLPSELPPVTQQQEEGTLLHRDDLAQSEGQPLKSIPDDSGQEDSVSANANPGQDQHASGIETDEPADDLVPVDATLDDVGESGEPLLAHAMPALPIGTLLLNRYYIVESRDPSDGRNIYRAEDRGICRSCRIEIPDAGEEQYCFNCGAHLEDPTLPWPALLLAERQAEAGDDLSMHSFVWQDRYFEISPDDSAENVADTVMTAPRFAQGVNLLVGQRSDVGITRAGRPDEDSICAITLTGIYESHASPTIGLYVVADGMGGHGNGEVASRIAVETIGGLLLQTVVVPTFRNQSLEQSSIIAHIDGAIQTANRVILEENKNSGNDMGTTVTLALVMNDVAYIANVGDSRTYLWTEKGLQRITDDHSVVFNLFKAHALEEDEIYDHPRRSEIFRSLGAQPRVEVDHFQTQLTPGNMLVLCCDGLWEMLRSEGIADVLMLGLGDPQAICDELVRRANAAGGEDNISLVVVRVIA